MEKVLSTLLRNIIASGIGEKYDIESMRKIMLLNIISITGIIFLIPLGIVAHAQGNSKLGFFDHCTAIVLLSNILYLRRSGNYQFSCIFGIIIAGLLYIYLLVTGGVNNTAHVWYFTFPLFSSFLLGSKNGAIASILLLIAAIVFFAFDFNSPHLTKYTNDFIIRFIPAYSVILIYSFAFEYFRENSQRKLTINNEELNRTIGELKVTDNKLRKTQEGLEQIVQERTGELLKANMELNNEIDERKEAEEALKDSEERYRDIVERTDNLITRVDSEGKFIYLNTIAEKIFGVSNEETIGMSAFDFVHPDDRDKTLSWFNEAVAKHHVYGTIENRQVNKKTGKIHEMLWSSTFHYDPEGNLVNVNGIARDLTDYKDLERRFRQAQKMESIGTLAGGIAHDFNNILYMITGNAELALEDIPEWNPVHENLKEIKDASLRAASIVKQLLNFSRKIDHELKPVGAVAVIKDALEFLRVTIPATIEIRKHLPDTDKTIMADPIQINQILVNICTNASQEMEESGGILGITVEYITLHKDSDRNFLDLTTGKYLKMRIDDTGSGIDPDIIDHIFDPYFTTKGFGKASGMGLTVVHGIVKNHGGAITVDSQPGKGTTFTILFPLATEEPVIEVEKNDTIPSGNESTLIVDDDAAIANMTRKMLERLGYEVKTATNPVQALELFQSNPYRFDLVITDMTMPQMTGVKLSEKLKGVRADIPVIICTGHSSLIDEEISKEFGINAYVMKPIKKKDLAKTIRKVLDDNKNSS